MSPSAIPDTFRAYVAEKTEAADGSPTVRRGVRDFASDDLPDGEVEIRVDWSSVNFKDGLATRIDGKVARISPLIPGIDLAGHVVSSTDRRSRPATRSSSMATSSACRGTAATPSTSACRPVG